MYLLDTSVLSELIKRQPSSGFIHRLRQQAPERLFTSAICVTELRYGAFLRSDRELFWQRVQQEILSHVQILEFGYQEALVAGELLAYLKRTGKPVGLEDVLIGATARTHGFTVVTHNVRHFQHLPNVTVEDWLTG
jgi:predicted nucleic acid-binding protein